MSLASRKLIQATAGATTVDTGDDDFANVVLLLDGDGTSGDANNTFTDSSTNGFTVTESGSVLQGSFSPYGDNWSNYFGAAQSVVASDSAIAMGSGDWTLELWVYFNAVNNGTVKYLFDWRTGADTSNSFLAQESNSSWTYYNASGSDISSGLTSSTFNVGTWHHVALSRNGSTLRFFVDGTNVGSPTDSTTYDSSTITIGNRYTGSYGLDGYISNVRVVKGTALYTSAFTPPTDPLTAITNTQLLTCQSNRFVDESTNNSAITLGGTPQVTPFSPFKNDDARDITTDGGSANFDSSEYLTIADNASLDVSGAMTAEIWVYFTDMPDVNIGSSGSGYLFNRWTASGNQRSWGIFVGANGAVSFYVSNTGSGSYTKSHGAAGSVGLYRWHHVAVSWDGSNQRLFIDGDLKVTTANTSGPFSTSSAGVTVNSLNVSVTGTNMNAYYSDARYFADAAIYTSSFTPPTSPLTATSGSDTAAVLLNFQDSAIPDLSGLNNIDTVGNAKVGASDPTKYGSNAMQFDGSGDYLLIKYQTEDFWNLNNTDFTLEFWAYASSLGSFNGVLSSWEPTTAWLIETVGSDMRFYINYSGSTSYLSMGSISAGAWNHWAVTREGTTLRTFKDGTLVTSTTQSVMTANTNPLIVGAVWEASTSSSGQWNGYVDDLRITKGIARYTASFTPPDAALPKF